jgi:hypothetical protein
MGSVAAPCDSAADDRRPSVTWGYLHRLRPMPLPVDGGVLASVFIVVFSVFVVAFAVLCVVIVTWAIRRDRKRWGEWRDRQDQ